MATPKALEWEIVLSTLRTEGFASPWRGSQDYATAVQRGIDSEDAMHPQNIPSQDPYWHPYVRDNIDVAPGQGTPNYSQTSQEVVPERVATVAGTVQRIMSHLFTTMNNPHHPTFQANVLPPTTIPGTIGAITGMKLNPNLIDEHYSLNVAKAEMELWSMLGKLLPTGTGSANWPDPWAPPSPESSPILMDGVPAPGTGSGGIVTFGGTGCYFYGIKYALTSVAGAGTRETGCEKGKFVFMVSNQGHYCHSNISDWCGMGYGNVIKIRTLPDNTMDLADLEAKMSEATASGKVVIAVVGTFGTTDAGALDDIATIRTIISRFTPVSGFEKPKLYADSVIGWVWLFFQGYDFAKNPLQLDPRLLEIVKENFTKAQELAQSDAFGVDFHKTGFSHYAASMVLFKDYGDFATLMQRGASPYLQPEQYDPGLYTLETSRSSVGSAGPWATIQYLGKQGMQVLAYNLLARQDYLRNRIAARGDFAICNAPNHLYSTLMRLYPSGTTNAQEIYANELNDNALYTSSFKPNNELQRAYYQKLYAQLREQTDSNFTKTPHPSLTTGFRYTYYNPDGTMLEPDSNNLMQGVFALKSFVSTPFVDDKDMEILIEYLVLARDTVIKELILCNRSWKGADQFVPGDVPAGSDPYNHLIVARHIPNRYLVPAGYDFTSDIRLEKYLEQLDANIALTRTRIASIR
ncbi:MAG: hypothetical protein PCALPYG88_6906 [uncultured Paraburkholderia sp.]|uniref:pyridoxal phosphate-dependent decarboxylase family protein n=1 Tax=uncultured Paraburkholderia sp. TaxID=1822466 RepID=UPI002593D9F5|nr:pyridoxal-dependent decarboxylase [uncultured Paraburkholderia sp.]CAH2903960.1 MAG: hypothetical protein PCALPYG08_7107 [uncultured Paraburkholderia sp.]CAH2941161.1 MAG: hypothetical protein PCALPYG88_6906 [uncultured Paraburkholderia sp.]